MSLGPHPAKISSYSLRVFFLSRFRVLDRFALSFFRAFAFSVRTAGMQWLPPAVGGELKLLLLEDEDLLLDLGVADLFPLRDADVGGDGDPDDGTVDRDAELARLEAGVYLQFREGEDDGRIAIPAGDFNAGGEAAAAHQPGARDPLFQELRSLVTHQPPRLQHADQ